VSEVIRGLIETAKPGVIELPPHSDAVDYVSTFGLGMLSLNEANMATVRRAEEEDRILNAELLIAETRCDNDDQDKQCHKFFPKLAVNVLKRTNMAVQGPFTLSTLTEPPTHKRLRRYWRNDLLTRF
jgi:hypothetical protein